MAGAIPSPAAGTSSLGAIGPELTREIEGLTCLDLGDLRIRWRQHLRSAPPPHLSRTLMMRLLAYRIQAKVLGDLDRDSARLLDRIAKERLRRRAAAERAAKPKAVPIVPPIPAPGLRPGTLLVREFAGEVHTVTVVAGGFAWKEASFTSLSEVARAITGTRWNGPRFFGLRDKVPSGNTGAGTAAPGDAGGAA
ncbi:hypothetical protein ASG40_04495 [Methylobacterium sp. Leaf399]|uniref:DUF2924 domain-containing protein n=1 Tax=unclassified Methylobacterium TaxID=2615210 RepID=UPI0006F86986|nr:MULTISPECIES: DUF2924 domain-containing protein [unclassified Methylobacterium]KQP56332.1 hypothetical protein ASF39_19135 [Methylobacterium sp. Leaf108]KQT14591.1 hypothetical protein ASG40_04495 [Methylobacterium sp. Leaf399]KQT90250.1 hypothetical protein ASG59_00065 [Methylobacterium sp. Leaf466]